jgi:hypothetical protein
VRLGYLDPATLARALGKLRRVPWVEPEAFSQLDMELARRLPAQAAHKWRAVPIKWLKRETHGGEVLVAFESPPELDVLDELSFVLGARIVPGVAPQELIDAALDRMFPVPRPKAYRVVDLDPHAPMGGVEESQEQVLRDCRAELEIHPESCVLLVDGDLWRVLTSRRPVLEHVIEYVRHRHDASGQLTVRDRRSRHLLAHFTGRGRPVAGKEPPGSTPGPVDELFAQRIHGPRGSAAPVHRTPPGVVVPPAPGPRVPRNAPPPFDPAGQGYVTGSLPGSGYVTGPLPGPGYVTGSLPPTVLGTVPPPAALAPRPSSGSLPERAPDLRRDRSQVHVTPVPPNGQVPRPAGLEAPRPAPAPAGAGEPERPTERAPAGLGGSELPKGAPGVAGSPSAPAEPARAPAARASRPQPPPPPPPSVEASAPPSRLAEAKPAPAAFPSRPPPPPLGAGIKLPAFPAPAHSILSAEPDGLQEALLREEETRSEAAIPHDPSPILAAMERAETPADVADALVDGLAPHLAAALVLVVKHDAAMGWRGHADDADPDAIESLIVPLTEPSVLARARDGARAVLSAPAEAEEPIHRRLWKLLRLEPPEVLAAAPVVLKGRVVNMIYLHPHPGETFPPDIEEQLELLCEAVAQSFLRLIRERK